MKVCVVLRFRNCHYILFLLSHGELGDVRSRFITLALARTSTITRHGTAPSHQSMRLTLLRSAWGLGGLRSGDRRRTMDAIRTAGWHGVEASLDDIGATRAERRECIMAAQDEGLALILSAYSSWPNYVGAADGSLSVQGHGDALRADLSEISELIASVSGQSPVQRVNAHSGSDAWSESEATDFFQRAVADTAALDTLPPVSHETHRGRYLCCPFATARMLTHVPSLRLTSDFSHWVIKCERLLDNAEERQLLATVVAPAVDHVHARIGTPQAPQVADVDHPAVAHAAERFYEWWETVWDARERRSLSGRDAMVTATIEYGPVETSGVDHAPGDYCGYTPVDLGLAPVAGVGLETTIARARDALGDRFERWHADVGRRALLV